VKLALLIPVGVFAGSTVALIVVYAWDEWSWRRQIKRGY
jgi:hypothetical protein